MATLLKRLTATDRRRDMFIILFWSVATASVYTQALYQRSYLTLFDQAIIVSICVLAGAAMTDIGKTLLGYVLSMALSIATSFLLTTLAISFWAIPPLDSIVLYNLWVVVLFRSTFPLAFIAYLVASIIGSALGEKYFY